MNENPQNDDLDTQRARSWERVRSHLSVAYSRDMPTPERKLSAYRFGSLFDISERGLSFRAPDDFAKGDVISLFIKLSNQTDGVRMLGKIVWTQPDENGELRVGVQFIGALPTEWREIILGGRAR